MEVAKTLPIFESLSVDDKVKLLSYNLLSNLTLMRAFYSADKQSSVMIYPDGSLPIFPFVLTGLEDEVYCRVLEPLKRVDLAIEEYVLLKAISYCNAGVEGLSQRARMVLSAERERYASALLKHLQRKHGRERGAVKYAEVIALVETYYYFGQRFHDHMLRVELVLRTSGRLRLRGKLQMIEDIMRR
ncbi:Protein NHR-36 [Aphelenchoides avenae]|nr:Protein NHR-36 [Aphelenchus avenae]